MMLSDAVSPLGIGNVSRLSEWNFRFQGGVLTIR